MTDRMEPRVAAASVDELRAEARNVLYRQLYSSTDS